MIGTFVPIGYWLMLFFGRGCTRRSGSGRFGFQLLLHLAAVAHKLAGRRKFAQAMPDHIFVYPDLDKIFAVVHRKKITDHLRGNL